MADKATDSPVCTICDPPRKHGRSEPHKFSKLAKDVVVATPIKSVVISQTASQAATDALEAYKAAERAKVLARVKKHRAKKKIR